jgi:hypothetical protein
MDRIVNGYLQATGTTAPEAAGQLHLGHPLVRAAVEEARAATHKRFLRRVETCRESRQARTSSCSIACVTKASSAVDRLITAAVLDGEDDPLDTGTARALLEQTPRDLPGIEPPFDLEDALADAMEQEIFIDQAEVATEEQQSFNQHMEQIERYVEDQILVLRRRLSLAAAELQSAREKRDAALGSDAREQAEQRIRRVEQQIEAMEAEVARLDNREDPAFEKWRERAHQRRFRPPDIVRILDVEFILE